MRTKKIIIALIVVFCSTFAFAQNNPKEKSKEPEPEVGTLEEAWKPVVMDHYFGVRGGYGVGSGRFEGPKKIMSSYKGMKNYGIFYRFDAISQNYVGCIEFSLNYLEKGFIYETSTESDKFYSRKYTMIEFPILWQPYLPLSSKNKSNRIFLNAGPYLGYALGNSQYREYVGTTGETISEGDYKYIKARDNFMEYGLVLGGGFLVAVKRFSLGLDFRYNIMLSDIMKNGNKYKGNQFRSPVDQMSISFSLGYKINRKIKVENPESTVTKAITK